MTIVCIKLLYKMIPKLAGSLSIESNRLVKLNGITFAENQFYSFYFAQLYTIDNFE